MARFLKDTDYTVQIRNEIKGLIDNTAESTKLQVAERMAVAQIRNHLSGRYDCDLVFTQHTEDPDTRDQYIVMLVIDLALYHLWSKEAANNIPKHRELRYNDALEWLKAVQNGQSADLPELTNNDGDSVGMIRIWSKETPVNNRY